MVADGLALARRPQHCPADRTPALRPGTWPRSRLGQTGARRRIRAVGGRRDANDGGTYWRPRVRPASRGLLATIIAIETDLTDATLFMFDKLMGSLARRAENRTSARA